MVQTDGLTSGKPFEDCIGQIRLGVGIAGREAAYLNIGIE